MGIYEDVVNLQFSLRETQRLYDVMEMRISELEEVMRQTPKDKTLCKICGLAPREKNRVVCLRCFRSQSLGIQ